MKHSKDFQVFKQNKKTKTKRTNVTASKIETNETQIQMQRTANKNFYLIVDNYVKKRKKYVCLQHPNTSMQKNNK